MRAHLSYLSSLTPILTPIPPIPIPGLYTLKVSFTCYLFAPRLLSRLRINQPVITLTARLDSRPVASGYLERILTCKITRHCQVAANG